MTTIVSSVKLNPPPSCAYLRRNCHEPFLALHVQAARGRPCRRCWAAAAAGIRQFESYMPSQAVGLRERY